MTTTTTTPTIERTTKEDSAPGGGQVGLRRQIGRVVAAEWTKARTVPSTWFALGAVIVIMVVIGPVISASVQASEITGPAPFEPLVQVMSGIFMSQVALGVLGALLITTEYSSRSIISTLAAVPQRGVALTAKALVLVALTTPAVLLAATASTAISLPILRDKGLTLELTDLDVTLAVLGTTVYLVLTALIGLAVGTVLRSTAGAVVVLTAVLFLLPVLFQLLPDDLGESVGPWLPTQAGTAVLQLQDSPRYLDPGAGLALAATYTAAALAAAAVILRRKDV